MIHIPSLLPPSHTLLPSTLPSHPPSPPSLTSLPPSLPPPYSYYPLLPAYRREDYSSKSKPPQSASATPTTSVPDTPLQTSLADETSEVNLDLIHMFDYKHACMSVRPDLLLLPSDLKPFAKVPIASLPQPFLPSSYK